MSFKILDRRQDITECLTELICNAVDRLDGFGITKESPLLLEYNLITNHIRNLIKKGKRVRYITDINNGNLQSCKKMMEVVELRHLDSIHGGMIINGEEYLSVLELGNIDDLITPVNIYSTNKLLVEQQKVIFDMLWEKAIPAKLKIKQIEQGLENEIFELITDEINTLKNYKQMLSSLNNELYVFYSVSDQDNPIKAIEQNIGDIIYYLGDHKSKNIKIILIVVLNSSLKGKIELVDFSRNTERYILKMKYIFKNILLSPSHDILILTADKKDLLISEFKV